MPLWPTEGGTERHMAETATRPFLMLTFFCRSGQQGVGQNGKKTHFLWELFFCFGELKRCSLPCYYTIGGDLWRHGNWTSSDYYTIGGRNISEWLIFQSLQSSGIQANWWQMLGYWWQMLG